MYSNKIIGTKDRILVSDLQEIEEKFKFKFPNSFREHFLLFNAGYPEKSLFKGVDGKEYVVDYFIPVKNENGQSLFKILTLLNDEIIKPNWLIPFADEVSGNLFCFSIRKENNGAIFYYSPEFEYGENPENHVVYLAETLIEFINCLEEYNE